VIPLWSRLAPAIVLGALTSSSILHAQEEGEKAQPSAAQVERAEREYTAAMERFEAGDYQAALEGFTRSYQSVPSPNSHFMIARAMAKLGNNEQAYLELSRVIREAEAGGGKYTATAESARAKRDEIRPRIGLVRVEAEALPKGSKLTLEGRPIEPDDYGEALPVLPGNVTLVVELPSGQVIEKKVFVETGGEKSIRLSKPRQAKEPEPTGAFVQRESHASYLIEVTVGGVYTLIEPPELPNQGGGFGGRLALQILPKGVVPGLNDGLAVGGGADFILSSVPSHMWFPIFAQWNVWITPELSAFLEPGVAIMTEGGGLNFHIEVGGRYMLAKDWLALTLRAGIPVVFGGVSVLF
jgi:hypothetical protein